MGTAQLTALCTYLNTTEGKGIKYVFYDYSCMRRSERDEEEERFFIKHLSQVNLLYLRCTVLVMLERSLHGALLDHVRGVAQHAEAVEGRPRQRA